MRHLIAIIICLFGVTRAQDLTLNISVNEFPPFVIYSEGHVTGLEIDLWNEIARDLGLTIHWTQTKNLSQVFNQVKSDSADVGVAGITITSQREKEFDFSHSYYSNGLNALLLKENDKGYFYFFKSIFTPRVRNILISIFIFVIFCSHLIWFFERGQDAFHDSYFPGVFEGAWWTIVTMSTVGYGDIAPKKWGGRVIAFFVILMGITFFGIAVAELSSTFTKEIVNSEINSIDDLTTEKVVVIEGTTSEEEAREKGLRLTLAPDPKSALQMVNSNQARAFITDEASLLYYVKKNPDKYRLLDTFNPQPYGFVFKENNPLKEKINRKILEIIENGRFARISNKWFDSRP